MAVGTHGQDVAVEPRLSAIDAEADAIAVFGLSDEIGTGQLYLEAVAVIVYVVISETSFRVIGD